MRVTCVLCYWSTPSEVPTMQHYEFIKRLKFLSIELLKQDHLQDQTFFDASTVNNLLIRMICHKGIAFWVKFKFQSLSFTIQLWQEIMGTNNSRSHFKNVYSKIRVKGERRNPFCRNLLFKYCSWPMASHTPVHSKTFISNLKWKSEILHWMNVLPWVVHFPASVCPLCIYNATFNNTNGHDVYLYVS